MWIWKFENLELFLLGSKLSSSKVVNNIEGYLNAFYFHIFVYSQIWQNV